MQPLLLTTTATATRTLRNKQAKEGHSNGSAKIKIAWSEGRNRDGDLFEFPPRCLHMLKLRGSGAARDVEHLEDSYTV